MILATTKVEDFDRFLKVFSTWALTGAIVSWATFWASSPNSLT